MILLQLLEEKVSKDFLSMLKRLRKKRMMIPWTRTGMNWMENAPALKSMRRVPNLEFLLDAATVIFKEQVEKAFRGGTARQNAHSIFVCLALKLLEDRVHVACKEIIVLEKQTKLLEEDERGKHEEEERKERRRSKERDKKLRRKERLKEKERDRERSSESNETIAVLDVSNTESPPSVDEEPSSVFCYTESVSESGDTILCRPESQMFKMNSHLKIMLLQERKITFMIVSMEKLLTRKMGPFLHQLSSPSFHFED